MSHANFKSFMYKIQLRRIELKATFWHHVFEKIVVMVSNGNFYSLRKIDLWSAEWYYIAGFHYHAFKNKTGIIQNHTKNLRDRSILIWKQFCLCRFFIHEKCKEIKVLPKFMQLSMRGAVLAWPWGSQCWHYPDSCEQGLKPPLEAGFGDRIHLFSCEREADSCQKSLRSQKYRDSRLWT